MTHEAWGRAPVYRICRWLCRVATVLPFDLRAYGIENVPASGGAIIVSNHQSYVDPVLIGVVLPRRLSFVAREGLFRVPLLGALLRGLGARPVDRTAASRSTLAAAVEIVGAGGLLTIFPEGSRSRDGRIGTFQRGFAFVAARSGAPVIPAAVRGAYEAWPRTRFFPRPGRLRVAFGEPLRYDSGRSDAFVRAIEERVRFEFGRLGDPGALPGGAPGVTSVGRGAGAGRPPQEARAVHGEARASGAR
ncbi:MAG: 1-acyl-sn-glycerol-3-phosphate acyltransferase [Planctomycetes bacterium]|nr:1-acyl-sn-glycerol-3-phosphate acyltransferase [Planctomycetota bacterium]